jgi:3-hydroxymyristoyl/3-hydroxydecanoyl-(acyl carrier protein) dehydratase
MGFLFVDSIDQIKSGKSARGRFKIPAGALIPPNLLAEGVGQLAGWIAMEHCDFLARPVAGIVGQCVIETQPPSGDEVELEVEAGTCDSDAIEYRGSAMIEGHTIVRLSECVGPMLPMEEFDDPLRVAKRFELLRCGRQQTELTAELLASTALEPKLVRVDQGARAVLEVPESSAIYAEHFPRKPVLPGTLLLDAQMRLGLSLVARGAGPKAGANGPRMVSIRNLKIRSFLSPGTTVELGARLMPGRGLQQIIALSATLQGKSVAAASMEIEP